MDLRMDHSCCISSDAVLDLRKSKPIPTPPVTPTPTPVYMVMRAPTTPPPHPRQPQPQPYAPLTPPYYASYTAHVPPPLMESSDDASDMSGASPPSAVTSSFLMTSNVINAGSNRMGGHSHGKPTRPFKAYPKDPLALTPNANLILHGHDSTDEYMEFRQRMLAQLESVTCRNNANMKRSVSPQMPTSTAEMDDKTAAYWERRRKNNEAAKRSRDARRAKEDEIAIRAAFLEQENIKLKLEVASLRNETAKLRCLAYNR